MKKGFTLVETIGALVILAMLILVSITVVDSFVKSGKDEMFDNQINTIELSMAAWVNENQKPDIGETITLTLVQLKQSGLIPYDLKNPKTESYFPNDMLLNITNNEGVLSYNVLFDSGSSIGDYEQMPTIIFNGDTLDYVEVDSTGNSPYIEEGVMAKSSNGTILTGVTMTTEPIFDIKTKGTYLKTYEIHDNLRTAKVIRTIIVRDTTPPVISGENDLTIRLSQVNSYDFESDITVTDNSGEVVDVLVEHNIGVIPGTYTVKYIATDTSFNTTTKLRKVIVTG